jgi:hypothetical protein
MPASYGYIGMVLPFLLLPLASVPDLLAEHSWPGCDFRGALRPGYGNDLHVSVCGGAIGVAAASALHSAIFRRQLVFRLSETPLSLAQQKLLEQPGAAERIRQIDSGWSRARWNKSVRHFTNRSSAAFTGTLRLNVIVPIAIAILTMMLMIRKEGRN